AFVCEVHSLARITVVTRKHQSCRCVDKHLAGLAAKESILLEVIDETSRVVHREEWVPAQATVESQACSCFPGVLNIHADVVRPFEIALALRLSDGVDSAEQKVRKSQAGQLPIETDRPVGELRVVLVGHAVDKVRANGNLMRATEVIQIL